MTTNHYFFSNPHQAYQNIETGFPIRVPFHSTRIGDEEKGFRLSLHVRWQHSCARGTQEQVPDIFSAGRVIFAQLLRITCDQRNLRRLRCPSQTHPRNGCWRRIRWPSFNGLSPPRLPPNSIEDRTGPDQYLELPELTSAGINGLKFMRKPKWLLNWVWCAAQI